MAKLEASSRRGGSKPGERRGGRQKGAKNKHTKEREAKMAAAAEAIKNLLPNVFAGDAHALLMAVYKNELADIDLRIDAAKAAIRYEKPTLVAAHTTDGGKKSFSEWLEELESEE